MIKIENLYVNFNKTNVLENINLNIKKGDFLYLLGPNGGGKSTLVKAIFGFVNKSKGNIVVDTRKVSYLPQSFVKSQDFPATVYEILDASFNYKWHENKPNKNDIINNHLKKLDIYDLKNKLISKLSGGEFQKVMFIKSILNNPELLILDEPLSAVDTSFRKVLMGILNKLNERGTTIILITHDISYIDAKCNHNVLYLDRKVKYYNSFCDYHINYLERNTHA